MSKETERLVRAIAKAIEMEETAKSAGDERFQKDTIIEVAQFGLVLFDDLRENMRRRAEAEERLAAAVEKFVKYDRVK